MVIAVMTMELYAPWVHSLKEKRMEIKSLISRIQNRFHISAAETGQQDQHQKLEISVAAIAADSAQADSILDHVLSFTQANTEADISSVERSFR